MAAQISIVSIEASGQQIYVTFNVALSGNYPTGGDTLDFTKATQDAAFVGLIAQIESSQGPDQLSIWSQGGNLAYQYVPVKGSAQNNSKLKVGANATFGTELSAGAYPAAVTGDSITGSAVFAKKLI